MNISSSSNAIGNALYRYMEAALGIFVSIGIIDAFVKNLLAPKLTAQVIVENRETELKESRSVGEGL